MGKEEHLSTIIVAVIIINEQDKLLMIQEAKKTCYGKWYIPAGKVFQGEHIKEAAIRECEEETGLKVEPTGIFSVEYQPYDTGYLWVRYGITGRIVGGTLKTIPDNESLCAKWVTTSELKDMIQNGDLRGNDILQLVNDFRKNPMIPFR